MTRRESLRALISGGAAYRERPARKGARAHHQDTQVYHGPLTLPVEIVEALARAPVFRTTSKHPALRVQRDGITYLLRTAPSGVDYVGEVIRTEAGPYRVHAWTVSLAGGRPVAEVIARDQERLAPPVSAPTLPVAPETTEDYSHYFDAPEIVGEEDLADLQMPRKVTLEPLID
jgi:hypothetical protein